MSDLITTIRATVMRGVTAKLAGATSRGVRACAIDDNGHLIFTLTDGSVLDLGKVVGDDGVGIVSIAKTGTAGLVDTYTITYTNGTTSSYTVTNGAKGDPGDKGDKGDTGDPGYTPVRGTDYWTAADKAEIVDDTIDKIVFTVTFTETNGVITADKTILEILDAIDAKNRIDFTVAGSNVVYQSFARGGMVGGYGEVSLESIASVVIDGVTPYVLVFAGTSDGETETWTYESKELALREDEPPLKITLTESGGELSSDKTVATVYDAIQRGRRISVYYTSFGETIDTFTRCSRFELFGTTYTQVTLESMVTIAGSTFRVVIEGVSDGTDAWSLSDEQLALHNDKAGLSLIAAEFSSGTSYSVGDYCIKNGLLYKRIAAGAAGAWDASKWQSVRVDTAMKKAETAADVFTVTFTESGSTITANKTVSEIYTAISAHKRIDIISGSMDASRQVVAWGESSAGVTSVSLEAIGTTTIGDGKIYGNVLVGTFDGTSDTWSVSEGELAMKSLTQTKAITDAGGYFTNDTVEAALQQLGAELSGVNALIGSGSVS